MKWYLLLCNKWTNAALYACARPTHYYNTITRKVNKMSSILSTFEFGGMAHPTAQPFLIGKIFIISFALCECVCVQTRVCDCMPVCVGIKAWAMKKCVQVSTTHNNISTGLRCSWIYVEAKPLFVKTIIPFILNEHHFGPEFCVCMHSDSVYDPILIPQDKGTLIIFDINKLEQFN